MAVAEAVPLAPPAQAFDSRRHWRACLLLAAAGLAADQALEALVVSSLDLGVVHVLNPGAAFSFLAEAGGWQRWFFVGVGIAVSVLLAGLLWRGVASRQPQP